MTWKDDVELERCYRERVADAEKYGYAYRTPERGRVRVKIQGTRKPIFRGPESTLSLARRHYAQVDDPPARPAHTWREWELRMAGLRARGVR